MRVSRRFGRKVLPSFLRVFLVIFDLKSQEFFGKTLQSTMKLKFFSLEGRKPLTQRRRVKIPEDVNP